jgi:hypothetical protein
MSWSWIPVMLLLLKCVRVGWFAEKQFHLLSSSSPLQHYIYHGVVCVVHCKEEKLKWQSKIHNGVNGCIALANHKGGCIILSLPNNDQSILCGCCWLRVISHLLRNPKLISPPWVHELHSRSESESWMGMIFKSYPFLDYSRMIRAAN